MAKVMSPHSPDDILSSDWFFTIQLSSSGVKPEPGKAIMKNPEGEANDGTLRLDFDRRLKLEFHGSQVRAWPHHRVT
jgi:hypothetical protein